MKNTFRPYFIFPFFLVALISGILGGWVRMGWDISLPAAAGHHGLLMTGGFIGGLITLERTITSKNKWWLIFPLLCGLSTVLFLLDQERAGTVSLVLSSAGLVAFYFMQTIKYEERYWYILMIGAVFWLIGNFKVLQSSFIPAAINWWAGFILFTIVGERLELTKFLPVPSGAKKVFWGMIIICILSLLLSFHGIGSIIYGGCVLLISGWLIRYDVARITAMKKGHYQYIGIGILVGYGWLIFHGIISLFFANRPLQYDLFIHTIFLGFAFSMIWAHAPLILPAILRLKYRPFHPIIWLFWGIFQLTLVGRILFSMTGQMEFRKMLGALNGVAILLMFLVMGAIIIYKSLSNHPAEIKR